MDTTPRPNFLPPRGNVTSITARASFAGTEADDNSTPAALPWGRIHSPDDLREMGIDAEEARKAWRSHEYAAGHDHGKVDGRAEAVRAARWPAVVLAVVCIALGYWMRGGA